MDLERIERALREGPVDEPVYVPGAFRRTRPSAWWFAAAATAGAAGVAGVVIGLGLDVLRSDRIGTAPDADELVTELAGRWVSDEIPFDRWVDELVGRGYDPNDLGNFLLHDPFDETVRYVLIFEGSQLSMQAIYDGRLPDRPERRRVHDPARRLVRVRRGRGRATGRRRGVPDRRRGRARR